MKLTEVVPFVLTPHVGIASLESILCTEVLHQRRSRPPDYAAEIEALSSLMGALSGSPRTILQTLAETVLKVLKADSAGLSLVTKDGKRFFWAAIAGEWQPHIGGGTPRDSGPCGDVLDCDKPLLFKRWEKRYPYLSAATPLAEEGLLVPFYVGGKSVGTIWAIAHDDQRHFDSEDLRLLTSLGKFASAAYQAVETLEKGDDQLATLGRLEETVKSQHAMETINSQLNTKEKTARFEAEDSLRESESRASLVIEALVDYAILTLDPTGIVTSWNEGGERMKGYTRDEIIGQNFSKFYLPEDLKRNHPTHELQVARETGRYEEEGFRVRKDGSRFWANVIITPLNDADGKLLGFSKVTRDLTERKNAEDALKALNESLEKRVEERTKELNSEKTRLRKVETELSAALSLRDEFLSTLSHELRTPITSILSWSQLIQTKKLDPDKIAYGVKVIEQSAKMQTQLIDDLLDVTRIQSGKLSISFAAVSPTQAVLSAIETVSSLAETKKIVIEFQNKIQSEKVWADSDRLQQVVWNLLTNAIKFSPIGGVVRVIVKTKEEQDDRLVSIEVIDSGKGIRPEFVPKLFERFTQADSSSVRVHGGLGLGLAIVRDLVTLQGGSVRAESDGLGKGASFTVLLPVKSDTNGLPSETASFAEMKIKGDAELANLSGLHVMIVEDDPRTLEVISETLKHLGAKILPCSTVREALAAFEKFKPDVLMSDISMPIEDGYSLIQKIRKFGRENFGDVPALALTAFATPGDAQKAFSAGFDSHMAKPFDMVRLGHAIAALANLRKRIH